MSSPSFTRVAALVAALALGSSPRAWASDVPFEDLFETASVNLAPAPATQGPPTAPPAPHISQLALSTVPKQAIPPPLDPSYAPARVPETTSSTSLHVAGPTRLQIARFKAGHEPVEVHIESTEPGVGSGYFTRAGSVATAATKVAASCTKGAAVVGLRWEHALISEKGELTLDVDDGWFDPSTCALSIERRVTLHPSVVQADRGLPLAFALRSETGLTLLFAPGATLAADASGELGQGNGALLRVTVPLERGGAASVLAVESAVHLAEWRIQAMGREVPANTFGGDIAITLGIDAVQTVADTEPSVTIRSFEQNVAQALTSRSPRRFPAKALLPSR